MSKAKKVTYKELMDRNEFLLSKLMQTERAIDYTHTLLLKYNTILFDLTHEKKH